MAGVGDAWGTREEMLHPRDSHGRFRSKWKMSVSVVDKLMKFLGSFNPKTFGNDEEAGGYVQDLGRSGRSAPGGTAALGKFLRSEPAVQAKLRSGDTSSPEVKAIDNSMTPLPDDMILTQVTGPEAFGLTPETIGQVEEYTGHLVSDKGYTVTNIGTPLPHAGPAVTITIATPAGTKAAIPRSNGGREIILDRDQPLRITKVDPDGKGGFYVLAVAEPKGASGSKRTTNVGGKVPAPEPGLPQPQQAPGAAPAPGAPEAPAAVAPAAPTPGVLVPQKKVGRPAGPPPAPRNDGHVAESIGGKPVAQDATPTPGAVPEVPGEPIPQQPDLPAKPAPDPRSTFRGAFKKADLKSPSEGKRRQQFNEAYLGAATGKKTPQEAVETLEHHITLNEAILKSDKEDGTDSGPLPGDIKAQKDLAQLIKDHFGLEGAKTEEKPAKKAAPAKKATPEAPKKSFAEVDAEVAKGERERKGAIRKEMRERIPAKAPESDEARLLAEERNRRVEAKDKASDAAAKAVADKWLADAGISRDDLSDFELIGLKVVSSDVASKKISGPEGLRRLKGGKGNLAKVGAKAPAKRAAAPKKAAGPLNDDLSNATIAQLREEAKKRDIKIPSSVRRKEDIRQHILDASPGAPKKEVPAPEAPKKTAVTTIEPAWATVKGHGGSGTMLYYGRGKKPDAEPRRVKVNFDRGLAHFVDAETGEKIRSVGVASKFWATPDAPLKKVDAPAVKKAAPEAPKASTPSVPEKAAGTAKGKLTASRIAPGTRILVRKDAKGDWAPTATKTGATPITVTSKDASTAGGRRGSMRRSGSAGYVITGKDDDGNEITVKPVTPSQTFWLHEKKEVKAPAAKKARPSKATPGQIEAPQELQDLVAKTSIADLRQQAKDADIKVPASAKTKQQIVNHIAQELAKRELLRRVETPKPVAKKAVPAKVAPKTPRAKKPPSTSIADTTAKVEKAFEKANPTPAGPKMSTAPLTENQWGKAVGGEVNYHEDGDIGLTVGRLGDDRHLEVDSQPLADTLGMIATDGVRGKLTSQQVADEIADVAKKLPEGSSARRLVEGLAERLNAPARPPLEMPKGTPIALRNLMADLSKIPLARRQGTGKVSEMDKLQAISERFASGEIRPTRLLAELQRELHNNRHESVEGKFEIDRAVEKAMHAVEAKVKADREARRPRPTGTVKGEAVLAAAPATLTRPPKGHHGDYTGEALDAPPGHGSVRALSEYEGVEYDRINGALRRGGYPDRSDEKDPQVRQYLLDADEENRQRIAEIDKTMKVSRLTSDVEVHRGVKNGLATFGPAWHQGIITDTKDLDEQDREYERWQAGERPDLTGLKFTDPGFTSTTADPAVADDFVKHMLKSFTTIEGEPVVMKIIVPKGTGGIQLAEWGHAAEILLERGLSFEVVADHGVDDKGYRRLDVKVVPK